MFKSFHWGHGIFVFYVFFVGVVATALIASFSVDHSLVIDDYYAQDLAYQSTYEKIQNNLDSKNIDISVSKEYVEIDFHNTGSIKGKVHFYRASNKSQDFSIPINNSKFKVTRKELLTGKWTLKIEWQQDGISYYKEEIIYI